MFSRRLALPPRSFLLLGPRGTSKTTWLHAFARDLAAGRVPRAR